MKVYLAAPVDRLHSTAYETMLDRLYDSVRRVDHNMVVFTPGRAYLCNKPWLSDVEYLRNVNDAALVTSDVVLVWYVPGVESWGVPQELQMAKHLDKWVVLVQEKSSGHSVDEPVDELALPLYLRTCVDMYCSNFDDALRACKNHSMFVGAVDGGEEQSSTVPSLTAALKWVSTGGILHDPKLAGDVGFDMESVDEVILEPFKVVKVDAGIRIELPEGVGATIMGRSGTANSGVLVFGTLIDEGYRGPMFSIMINLTDKPVFIPARTRVAQLVLLPNLARSVGLIKVDELSASERGDNGFGSTGSSIK